MKLYISPASCSLAPHIVLQELDLPFTTERVDLREKKTSTDQNFLEINPKGYVPALALDSGELLTECAVVLQYLADQKPDAGLIPKFGTFERYRLQEKLNYVATEIHKGFSPLWNKQYGEDAKTIGREALFKKFDLLNGQLKDPHFFMGERYTVVDAYLFTVLNWCSFLKIDLSKWLQLFNYVERVRSRPAVQKALRAEGLIKE